MSELELHPVYRMTGNPLGTVLPEEATARFDPILVFHEQGPIDYAPQEAVGFPNHPHRGFETVTYVVEGEQYHRDSFGHEGVLRAGDVQWMTAAAGIFHSELPTEHIFENGGRVHAFQIWLNLPHALKMSTPRYQEFSSQRLPVVDEDGAWARVIAGEAGGATSPIATVLPTTIVHVRLASARSIEVTVPDGATTVIYAMSGSVQFAAGVVPARNAGIVRGLPSPVRFTANASSGFEGMIVSAVPIGEPVVSGGPFVMTTQAEIRQAYDDLRNGRFGMPAEIIT